MAFGFGGKKKQTEYQVTDRDAKAKAAERAALQAREAAIAKANKDAGNVVDTVIKVGGSALVGGAGLANLPALTNMVQVNFDTAKAPISQDVGTKAVINGSFADKYSDAIKAADSSKMNSNKPLTIGEFTTALNAGDSGEDFKFIHANSGQEVTYQDYSDDENSGGYIITRK